jgi:hypothetical protein
MPNPKVSRLRAPGPCHRHIAEKLPYPGKLIAEAKELVAKKINCPYPERREGQLRMKRVFRLTYFQITDSRATRK